MMVDVQVESLMEDKEFVMERKVDCYRALCHKVTTTTTTTTATTATTIALSIS